MTFHIEINFSSVEIVFSRQCGEIQIACEGGASFFFINYLRKITFFCVLPYLFDYLFNRIYASLSIELSL